jgi:hypothetical protein
MDQFLPALPAIWCVVTVLTNPKELVVKAHSRRESRVRTWSASTLRHAAGLSLVCLLSPTVDAQTPHRVFKNSRLYFSTVQIAILGGERRPALVRLTCAENFRVGGYQLIPTVTPVPITVTKVNYAVINEWTLELVNSAELPKPAFPLTVGFVCVDASAS